MSSEEGTTEMDTTWWQATPQGHRRIPNVCDPITASAFHHRCRSGEILLERRPQAPARVYLDPVAQAARRVWRPALDASLDDGDCPVELHLLCIADWQRAVAASPGEALATVSAWTSLADRGAWATVRFDCAAGTGFGRARDPAFMAPVRSAVAVLSAGRYRTAATLLIAGQRRLGAREALLTVPGVSAANDDSTSRLDYHRLDNDDQEPPRISLAEIADWIAEAHGARTAIVAHSAATPVERSGLLAVFPTNLVGRTGLAVPAVGVLSIPQPVPAEVVSFPEGPSGQQVAG